MTAQPSQPAAHCGGGGGALRVGAQAAALHQLYDTALKCLTVKKKRPANPIRRVISREICV